MNGVTDVKARERAATPGGQPPGRRSFAGRGLLVPALVLLALAVILALIGWAVAERHAADVRGESEAALLAIQKVQSDEIARWYADEKSDTLLLAGAASVVAPLEEYLAGGARGPVPGDLDAVLELYRSGHDVAAVAVYDERLRLIVESPGRRTPEPGAERRRVLAARALGEDAIVFSGAYLAEDGSVGMDFAAPVRDRAGRDVLGVLLVHLDAEDVLYPVLAEWPSSLQAGQTELAAVQGDQVVSVGPALEEGPGPLTMSRPLSDPDLPVAMAARGATGVAEGVDDQGRPVLAALGRVPETPWYLVVSQELAVIEEPIRERALFTLGGVVGTIVLAGVVLLLYWRSREIGERKATERRLEELAADLERRVRERTDELRAANAELEAFSYSVSHDLRAPLRALDGFSLALVEDYGNILDGQAADYLGRIRGASQRMGLLIDDLLMLSRVTRRDMTWEESDLSALARGIGLELAAEEPGREVAFTVTPDLTVEGDRHLLDVLLRNLLGNAWKFTSRTQGARVEVGVEDHAGTRAFFVRDNGAGFDPRHADKLFTPFQRLHGDDEFPGIGIGLATVQRIVRRHGGRVWAEGETGKGATVWFTLGSRRDVE